MSAPFSRRHFLQLVGASGGSATAYRVALGLGLAPLVKAVDKPDIAPQRPKA